MTDVRETFVRRLVATVRSTSLYTPGHPLIERNVAALLDTCHLVLRTAPSLAVAFLENEVVVDRQPVSRGVHLVGDLPRALGQHGIEKLVVERGVTAEELRAAVAILGKAATTRTDRSTADAHATIATALREAGVRRVSVGPITAERREPLPRGIETAIRRYDAAMETAEAFWDTTRRGGEPDTAAARDVVRGLAGVVTEDRPSILALTTLKRHDAYTFTHMVNVAILTMALGRAIGVDGRLVREFGLAALMHDIGKTRTPLDVLNKPGQLSPAETETVRRHVIDGAEILWNLPDMSRLAAMVAFQHHMRHDLSGYPQGASPHPPNLCTQIVSIADMFDALRTNRPYRQALAPRRVRDLLAEQAGTAFDPVLLRQFVRLVGLFPVGTLVRLESGEIGIVTHEHPEDPLRPQVKVVLDCTGHRLEESYLVNTWERDRKLAGIVEAVEGAEVGLDPITLM